MHQSGAVFRPLKHHVLEQVRESASSTRLEAKPNLVIDTDGHQRCRPIRRNHHSQSVFEYSAFDRYVQPGQETSSISAGGIIRGQAPSPGKGGPSPGGATAEPRQASLMQHRLYGIPAENGATPMRAQRWWDNLRARATRSTQALDRAARNYPASAASEEEAPAPHDGA